MQRKRPKTYTKKERINSLLNLYLEYRDAVGIYVRDVLKPQPKLEEVCVQQLLPLIKEYLEKCELDKEHVPFIPTQALSQIPLYADERGITPKKVWSQISDSSGALKTYANNIGATKQSMPPEVERVILLVSEYRRAADNGELIAEPGEIPKIYKEKGSLRIQYRGGPSRVVFNTVGMSAELLYILGNPWGRRNNTDLVVSKINQKFTGKKHFSAEKISDHFKEINKKMKVLRLPPIDYHINETTIQIEIRRK